MKILTRLLCSVAVLATIAFAAKPVQNLQVTLRGKQYDISDVTTVGDVQKRVKEASGVGSDQQGRVLFAGKRLEPSAVLSDVGVEDGAQLSIVPSSTKSKKKTEKKASSSGSVTASSASAGSETDAMQDYLKKAGIGGDQMDELMKSMGKDGEKMPSMEESLGMMKDMLNSPLLSEYMNDPEKLEESRQMILNNPMLKSMMSGMPGMEELLNSPEAWREAMKAAVSMYSNMDEDQLKQMMNSMGGMGGAPGAGLFDGSSSANSAAAAALDELEEED